MRKRNSGGKEYSKWNEKCKESINGENDIAKGICKFKNKYTVRGVKYK